MKSRTLAVLGAVAIAGFATSAQAFPNLVMNGDFEQVSANGTTTLGTNAAPTAGEIYGSVAANTNDLPSWSTTDRVAVLFTPGSADTSGANGNAGGVNNGTVRLYGSNDGGSVVLPATSPASGNYLALDGSTTYSGPLTQTINGLLVGGIYTAQFYMAAAQETGNSNPTSSSFAVSLGSQTVSTEVLSIPQGGFSGWKLETLSFVATASSEVLSFLAVGSPAGSPPMALLDGVSLVYAPEPSTWAILIVGLAGVTLVARNRNRNRNQTGRSATV